MNATISNSEQQSFNGYPVNYYPARLSEWELEAILPTLARFCRIGCDPSNMLAAYLYAAISFERDRRDAIENGNEIVEVQMPEVPCHSWDGPELARALGKVVALAIMSEGEAHKMMQHLLNCIMAETQLRLGLKGSLNPVS